MTAEWLHLPPPYPPGVGPLCGAELEAWYEDLQDILGSDTGGAKLARAPTCTEHTSSSLSAAKKSRKEREQDNERKVQELTEQNEHLKSEIDRLGEEVQRTRRALIERLVNTRK
ncbi:DNA damage-inducible transcript 3 protein [Liparis tanakae]|uniref:DNA damage-inducible transcript 3 protein n=1 Tax=Liparis tanakae TaxID=230148 RepID=A0A4Z2IW88_9TELE|nr:DNA damage-inducible transcript 3 protein [Liparis tanakae]